MNRGDIVTVDFSRYDPSDKVLPALVVQNDRDNAGVGKTIVAFITSNVRRSAEETQYLILGTQPDFAASGLRRQLLELLHDPPIGYHARHWTTHATYHGAD